jgi:hypothetical protein
VGTNRGANRHILRKAQRIYVDLVACSVHVLQLGLRSPKAPTIGPTQEQLIDYGVLRIIGEFTGPKAAFTRGRPNLWCGRMCGYGCSGFRSGIPGVVTHTHKPSQRTRKGSARKTKSYYLDQVDINDCSAPKTPPPPPASPATGRENAKSLARRASTSPLPGKSCEEVASRVVEEEVNTVEERTHRRSP